MTWPGAALLSRWREAGRKVDRLADPAPTAAERDAERFRADMERIAAARRERGPVIMRGYACGCVYHFRDKVTVRRCIDHEWQRLAGKAGTP